MSRKRLCHGRELESGGGGCRNLVGFLGDLSGNWVGALGDDDALGAHHRTSRGLIPIGIRHRQLQVGPASLVLRRNSVGTLSGWTTAAKTRADTRASASSAAAAHRCSGCPLASTRDVDRSIYSLISLLYFSDVVLVSWTLHLLV